MPETRSPAQADLVDGPIRLWGQARRRLGRYGLGMLLLGAYQYAQYWFDTRLIVGVNAAVEGQAALAIEVGLWLAAVAVAAFGVRVLSRMAVFNAGRIAEYELRNTLLARLHRLGPRFYRNMSVGEIMSRATNDLTQVRLLLGFGALNVINTLFALASALTVTLTISVQLTLASLATLPALLLVTRAFARRMYTRTRLNQEAIGQLSETVQSSIMGVRVVRAFTLEEAELERFERANHHYLTRSLALARLRGSMGPVMQAISAAGMLIVFWYGGHLLLVKEIDPGGFLAFYRALARLTWPLMALGFVVSLVQRGRASFERLRAIYDAEPEVQGGTTDFVPSRGPALEVRGLDYAYNGRPVLQSIRFSVEAGQSLAIVGRTGSGKSTLARLLVRLESTPPETVFLDGHDICDLPVSSLRRAIGYSQQDPFLFSTTAARNMGYALDRPESPEGRSLIERAASRAQIHAELTELPDGLETVVGERGVQLSGGQKQRVALARALVYAPAVLILDDPLSAVDARTEKQILAALDEERSQRSVLLITHRVTAAASCDRIVVLDEGRIVAQGTHDELIAQGGVYAGFVEEQRLEHELEELAEPGAEEASP